MALAPEDDKTNPRRLDLMMFCSRFQKSTKQGWLVDWPGWLAGLAGLAGLAAWLTGLAGLAGHNLK